MTPSGSAPYVLTVKAVRERAPARESEVEASRPTLISRLFEPVDISSLVVFRVVFGFLLLADVLLPIFKGWIGDLYIDPALHFSYAGFDWVEPLPGPLMYALFAALAVLSVMFMLGLFYRAAATLLFLGFSYVFLLESALFLNHGYLTLLFILLMIFVPAHRSHSLDARRRPEIRARSVPAWTLWILRFQMGIVYLFGGIAKLNSDWFAGDPLREWLAARTDFPFIGGLFDQEWLVTLFLWGSLALDLFAFPLLLWRRTRALVFLPLLLFHLMNSQLFNIGIFPWMAIAATTLFFEPDWPRRLVSGSHSSSRSGRSRGHPRSRQQPREVPASLIRRRTVTAWLLGLYVAIQVLLPFRHLLYPGEVNWTEEGLRYSWRMMLREKKHEARFFVTPPGGETVEVPVEDHLELFQQSSMGGNPFLILQFAQYLERRYSSPDGPVEVRAHVVAALNGRPAQMLIDPRVDLSATEYGFGAAEWVIPLGDDIWIPPPGSQASSIGEYLEEVLAARQAGGSNVTGG